jgi:transcriptional regulator with XRE-family HTH domain
VARPRSADEIRRERGLPIRDLPVSRAAWYGLVKGGRKPHPATIRKVSEALGVEPGEIEEFRPHLGLEEIFEVELDPEISRLAEPAAPYGAFGAGRRELDRRMDLLPTEVVEKAYRAWRRRRARLEQQLREETEEEQ